MEGIKCSVNKNVQQNFIKSTCVEFHPNWTINLESAYRNSFTVLSKK